MTQCSKTTVPVRVAVPVERPVLTTIILTQNEEKHIARAIRSVAEISERVVVVDSGSSDRTLKIASDLGAQVLENAWTNHATQFNWALEQLPSDTDWVLRLDADEYLTPELSTQIADALVTAKGEDAAMIMSRRMHFMGKAIRWGGVFPIRIARAFRYGRGQCESRWMDEHIIFDGAAIELSGELIDDNLNSLSWWTEKHNAYASREAVEMLNLKHGFMSAEQYDGLGSNEQAGTKRWLKEKVYARLPSGLRATLYFLYRHVLRLGFLDGRRGTAFHVLQGFWYRYLVDTKVYEVQIHMQRYNVDIKQAIKDVLNVDVQ
tara:strand:+ start:611 stop:1567 length:957 start_codon:yes stop_codon:yes gene_type:complete